MWHGYPLLSSPVKKNVDAMKWRRVLQAVPVQEVSIQDGTINVEMDPEDQFKAVQALDHVNME